MKRLVLAALLAALTTFVVVDGDLVERPVTMDNRLYFFLAERAASGVPPHVSAPDVKTQLAVLVDAAWIRAGRAVGLDDVHAGRLGATAVLVVGVWGVAASVAAFGAGAGVAAMAGLAAVSFSGLAGHASVGFNPKILLFTLLAWLPWVVARGRFAMAGAVATAAVLCWQPAVFACASVAAAALATAQRVRSLAALATGGFLAAALYEAYFAWHGVLGPQLFQSWILPSASLGGDVDWLEGLRFVAFGSSNGIGLDRAGVPALSFLVLVVAALARLARLGARDLPVAPLVVVVVGGFLSCVFTAYEHQAEPDRFLLVPYFAIAMGVVADRVLAWLTSRGRRDQSLRLEGALALLVVLVVLRTRHSAWRDEGTLEDQRRAGAVVAMAAEAWGSVWSYRCVHLLGFAHVDNHHPLEHFWDDLGQYVDEETFEPRVDARLPDVIVTCGQSSSTERVRTGYRQVASGLMPSGKGSIFVRADLLAAQPAWPEGGDGARAAEGGQVGNRPRRR